MELGGRYPNEFDTFMKYNKRNVENCGINDHMLFHSLKSFCNIFDNNMNDNIFRIFEKSCSKQELHKISKITNDLIQDIKATKNTDLLTLIL